MTTDSATLERIVARLHATAADDSALDFAAVEQLVLQEAPLLPSGQVATMAASVLAEITGLGPLEPVLADESVTDVLVNGPGPVWIERHGQLMQTGISLTRPAIERLIERTVAPLGLRVDRVSPVVDARLPDGSRFNAVVPPLAVDGPYVAIRRFATRSLALAEFAPAEVVTLLAGAARAGRTILISGGTGAGKTTLLNALAAEIPAGQRIVTIEDAAELRLPQEHVVRLEARPANAEGVGAVSVRDLVRAALRLRPDRIVVGEVRGAEAFDLLQALNTGHEGSLSTCHANGPIEALRRIETLALLADVGLPLAAVREQVAVAFQLVVQLVRVGDGRRRISEVVEVGPPAEVGQPPTCRPVFRC